MEEKIGFVNETAEIIYKLFCTTGNVGHYLLYKAIQNTDLDLENEEINELEY